MTKDKIEKIAEALGEALGSIVFGFGLLAFKTWLLTLILGWLSITALGFWKAMVVIILIELILINTKRKKS
jgi:thiol:disulfide interchange protein